MEILKNTVDEIFEKLSDSEKEFFSRCTYSELEELHFGLGVWIRNEYLRKETPIAHAFQAAGVDSDAAAMLLIQLLYLKNNSFSL